MYSGSLGVSSCLLTQGYSLLLGKLKLALCLIQGENKVPRAESAAFGEHVVFRTLLWECT